MGVLMKLYLLEFATGEFDDFKTELLGIYSSDEKRDYELKEYSKDEVVQDDIKYNYGKFIQYEMELDNEKNY